MRPKKVEFDVESIFYQDLGLYVLSEKPNLEYNFYSFFDYTKWEELAFNTISLTILNLLINNIIELVNRRDEYVYFNTFKTTDTYYSLELGESLGSDDIISRKVLAAIREVKRKHGFNSKIFKIIHELLNDFLKMGATYSVPEKNFIVATLKLYARKYPLVGNQF